MQLHDRLFASAVRGGVTLLGASALMIAGGSVHATPVYLNDQNITVALGASHGGVSPFANVSLAQSLANVIDRPRLRRASYITSRRMYG